MAVALLPGCGSSTKDLINDPIEARLRGHEVFTETPAGSTEVGFACAPAAGVGFCLMIYATPMSPEEIQTYYQDGPASGSWRRLVPGADEPGVLIRLDWESVEYDVFAKVRDTSAWEGGELPDDTQSLVSLTLAER